MTTTPTARFEHLLSRRALLRWGAPVATARPVASPLYEFGGGYPDPASFPYDDMVEATARMMKAEGAQALTYGDPQGYRGLRELVCHKYRVFEGLEVTPENIFVANGSGHALSLAFSAFVDPGDPIICEAPTFSGSLNNIRRHGPEIRSEEHTSELQSLAYLVCRLLLEKKNMTQTVDVYGSCVTIVSITRRP